jgi:CMP-N,N'-diacetyllegionaminic acid synthase
VNGVLGIIPARGGSRGIPGKNIRLLAGRPLIEYTVRAAQDSGVIDRVILSTDSSEIAEVGRRLGVEVPFVRPKALAQDDTPMLAVVEHALRFLTDQGWSPEIVVLLQPTAPLRKPKHIADAIELLRSSASDAVASVVEVPRHMSPDYVMRIVDGRLEPFLPGRQSLTRRQDARAAYARDGTVYAFWRKTLVMTGSIYGNDCRPLLLAPQESVTLDALEDWPVAESRLRELTPGEKVLRCPGKGDRLLQADS